MIVNGDLKRSFCYMSHAILHIIKCLEKEVFLLFCLRLQKLYDFPKSEIWKTIAVVLFSNSSLITNNLQSNFRVYIQFILILRFLVFYKLVKLFTLFAENVDISLRELDIWTYISDIYCSLETSVRVSAYQIASLCSCIGN